MITIFLDKIKSLNKNFIFKDFSTISFQNYYNEIINQLSCNNFKNIYCDKCSKINNKSTKSDFVFHSRYKRFIRNKDDANLIKVEIQRIRCTKCHRTHALLSPDIVPYRWLLLNYKLLLIHLKIKNRQNLLNDLLNNFSLGYDFLSNLIKRFYNQINDILKIKISIDYLHNLTLSDLYYFQNKFITSLLQTSSKLNMAIAIRT